MGGSGEGIGTDAGMVEFGVEVESLGMGRSKMVGMKRGYLVLIAGKW